MPSRLSTMETKIRELETAIAGLKSGLKSAQTRIGLLKKHVEELENADV